MRTCPYCGQQAMTFAQKATLGPMKSVPCQSCGKAVSVSWGGLLALAAFLAGTATGLYLGLPWGIVVFLVGVIAMVVLHEYATPLVRRQ